jgi:uncharacterized protein (DUF1800 family)
MMASVTKTSPAKRAAKRPGGHLEVAGALAPYRGPWNQRLAAHLLRRAGFGGTPDEVRRYARMTPHDAVESLVRFPSTSNVPGPDNIFDARASLMAAYGQMRGGAQANDMARRQLFMGLQKQSRDSIISMQRWWLNRILTTPAPLQEKMTVFFHGHFTTAAIQKQVWPNMVYAQNQLYRSSALGNLRDLTLAVSRDPAMLLYLDNATSQKAHPNENYARELMELFTLGHGNYTEQDIRESARAFTGWTINRRTGEFVFNQFQHDDGTKHFLGQTGNFDGTNIVDIIYRQPAASKFWAQSLLNFFVYNNPEPALVDALAAVIKKNDFQLAPVMSTLLQSNAFYSDRAYRALVKSPVEFAIGTYKTFGLGQIDPSTQVALVQMGQILFYPPNVAGWPGGANWLTSQTMIARQNFVAGLMNSPMMQQQATWLERVPLNAKQAAHQLIATILYGDAAPQSYGQIGDYLNGVGTSALGMFSGENYQERVRGAAYLTMAMPAYQLN